MQLIFDSIDELMEFVDRIDGEATEGTPKTRRTRGPNKPKGEPAAATQQFEPKGDAVAQAASAGIAPGSGFTPPAGLQPSTGFPAATPQAQVHPLVPQIIAKTDQALTAGQPLDNVTGWFRQQLGAEAKDATWDQIKQAFLPKAAEKVLKDIAAVLAIPV